MVSGGQTGADRAALNWAIRQGIPHGGWVPKGRLAEDGRIPLRFRVRETPTKVLTQRTDWNVRDSDGTVIFTIQEKLGRGSKRTLEMARRLRKPCLLLNRAEAGKAAPGLLRRFVTRYPIQVLNVAGSRASQEPQVGRWVHWVLNAALGRAVNRVSTGPRSRTGKRPACEQ